MSTPRYCARIGEARWIAVDMSYDVLLANIMEFTIRAAVARASDESEWEHEQLRRNGVAALQLSRDGKALWDDPQIFTEELTEACREGVARRFETHNELDPAFYDEFDRDLRARWRRLGFESPSLRHDMKALFLELERDISERTLDARERMLADFITTLKDMT